MAVASYLASPEEAGSLADNRPMTPGPIGKEPYRNVTVEPFACTAATVPGIEAAYGGTAFNGFAAQNVWDADEKFKIVQVIASFASEKEAASFFDRQVNSWDQCTDTAFVASIQGGGQDRASTGVMTKNDGIAVLPITPTASADGRTCERAITSRLNTFIDVRVCGADAGGDGVALARTIADKVAATR